MTVQFGSLGDIQIGGTDLMLNMDFKMDGVPA